MNGGQKSVQELTLVRFADDQHRGAACQIHHHCRRIADDRRLTHTRPQARQQSLSHVIAAEQNHAINCRGAIGRLPLSHIFQDVTHCTILASYLIKPKNTYKIQEWLIPPVYGPYPTSSDFKESSTPLSGLPLKKKRGNDPL